MANPNFIKLTTNEILDVFKTAFYNQYGNTIRIGSEEYAASTVFAYCMTVLFAAMNDSAKQRYIDTATGEYLDAIAATYGITERPKGYKATCLVDITMLPVPNHYGVGALKIADTSGKVFTNARDFNYRNRYSILFEAVSIGSEYNGIPENAITEIITPLTGVISVSNTTMTGGGSDAITEDDEFRAWLKNEISSFAGAGTAEAYRGKAMNVDTRILDVLVVEQGMLGYEKGKVKIYILTDETVSQPEEVVERVYDAVSDRSFRPVGDFIMCKASLSRECDVQGTFHITYPMKFSAKAQERTERIIEEYKTYLGQKIHRPFVYGELTQRLMEKDDEGYYATECVVMGLEEEDMHPIYPEDIGLEPGDEPDPEDIGATIDLQSLNYEIHYDELDG